MPRVTVPTLSAQEALFERRHLLPPSDVGQMLGVTRQAIDKSAGRVGGQLLVWAFTPTEGPRRYRPLYVDFGPREGQFDPDAWQAHRDDPAVLIAQASGASLADADEPAVPGEHPTSTQLDEESLDVLTLLASGIVQYDRQLRAESPVVFP